MTIKAVTCHVAICDVCGTTYGTAPVFECTAYFAAREAAIEAVHADPEWLVTTDGRVICLIGDPHHQAALDALLPPAPAAVCDGQLPLDL